MVKKYRYYNPDRRSAEEFLRESRESWIIRTDSHGNEVKYWCNQMALIFKQMKEYKPKRRKK